MQIHFRDDPGLEEVVHPQIDIRGIPEIPAVLDLFQSIQIVLGRCLHVFLHQMGDTVTVEVTQFDQAEDIALFRSVFITGKGGFDIFLRTETKFMAETDSGQGSGISHAGSFLIELQGFIIVLLDPKTSVIGITDRRKCFRFHADNFILIAHMFTHSTPNHDSSHKKV